MAVLPSCSTRIRTSGGAFSHFLFHHVIRAFFTAGPYFGLSSSKPQLQSALLMSLAGALFYRWLRRFVSTTVALIYTLLLGLNLTITENATSVEIYGLAMLGVMTLMHVVCYEHETHTASSALWLSLCSLFVLTSHAGYGLLVAAIFMALIWRDRGHFRSVLKWMALGLLICLLFLALMLAERIQNPGDVVSSYLRWFWGVEGQLTAPLMSILETPLHDFSLFAGLVVFPGILGWSAARRDYSHVALVALFATLLFVLVFTFWVADTGEFFLPLHILWATFAAIAVQRMIEFGGPPRSWSILLICVLVYFVLFMLWPQVIRGVNRLKPFPRDPLLDFVFGAPGPRVDLRFNLLWAFWIYAVVSYRLGRACNVASVA